MQAGRFLVIIALFYAPVAFAATRSGSIAVSATVVPYLTWRVEQAPATIRITPEDIGRGFVEFDAGELYVRTNDRSGFLIIFQLESNEASTLNLEVFDRMIEVGPAGAFIVEPLVSFESRSRVRCRMNLISFMKPGEYPLPIGMKVARRYNQ